MSHPIFRALRPAKLRQYAAEAFQRQQNDYRNHPRGLQRLIFKVMFGAQFAYYFLQYFSWQQYQINRKRNVANQALREAHLIH